MMILPVMEFTIDGPYEEITQKKFKFENYVYLKINDKILKLGITADNFALKVYMKRLIENMEDYMFIIVDEEEMENCCFPMGMEYIGKFKLNQKRKTKNYKIPNPNLNECSLIYVLNSIYNSYGLTKEDLYNLRAEKEMCKNNRMKNFMLEDLISKLNIVVVEEYDYDKLAESVKYVSYVTNQENLWNRINLQKLKSILLEAENNIESFKVLDLYDTTEFIYPIRKQKSLRK